MGVSRTMAKALVRTSTLMAASCDSRPKQCQLTCRSRLIEVPRPAFSEQVRPFTSLGVNVDSDLRTRMVGSMVGPCRDVNPDCSVKRFHTALSPHCCYEVRLLRVQVRPFTSLGMNVDPVLPMMVVDAMRGL